MLRLGVIGSTGGSALQGAQACVAALGIPVAWSVVVDRSCGMERWALGAGWPCTRVQYDGADAFSRAADSWFAAAGCDDVLLFYTRRVAAPLIHARRVWNIHPALLPAFPGLHAVDQALRQGSRLLGATLHRVDAGLDTGPIVAQVACGLPAEITPGIANRLSYLQKVWLTLRLVAECAGDASAAVSILDAIPGTSLAVPGLPPAYVDVFHAWTRSLAPVQPLSP